MRTHPGYDHIDVILERFWSYVDKSDGCWIWMGGRDSHDYGQFTCRLSTGIRRMGAHRFAWSFINGPIPEGMGVLHHCDTPSCVRPDHLFVGDQLANMQDARAKGRAHAFPVYSGDAHWTRRKPELVLRGERHSRTKLSDAQVAEIRAAYEPGRRGSKAELSRQYGVTKTHIGYILSGQCRAIAATQ